MTEVGSFEIGPVATEIARLREEAKLGLIAAQKILVIQEFGATAEEAEAAVAEALKKNDTALLELEATAIQVGVIAYLEAEAKRRSEWETRMEERVNEVRRDAGFDRCEFGEGDT